MIYALEGLRGLAALAVALFHGWTSVLSRPFDQGWLCVDLFFVISGFVMSHVYRDRIGTGAQAVQFAVRRFGRLYPLHFATLFAYIACEASLQLAKPVAGLFGHATNPIRLDLVERWSLLSNLLLLHGMGIPGERVYNNASWSISTEIWAYALFALTTLAMRPRLRTLAWVGLALIGLASLFHAYRDVDSVNSGVYFFRCMYGFFLGALMPILRGRLRDPGRWLGALQVASLAACLAAFATVGDHFEVRYIAPLAFAALTYLLSFDRGIVAFALRHPWAQSLGKLSYSIYLTHALILIFFDPVGEALTDPSSSLLKIAYVAVVLGVSHLTYRWIEDPWRIRFQNLSNRLIPARDVGGGSLHRLQPGQATHAVEEPQLAHLSRPRPSGIHDIGAGPTD